MFKPTSPLFKARRRLALTTKRVNGGFYKGNRVGSMGAHTPYGGYIIDWTKVRTYVPPDDLANFRLTPFVTEKMEPTRSRDGGITGQKYLYLFREKNPEEYGRLYDELQREIDEQRKTEIGDLEEANIEQDGITGVAQKPVGDIRHEQETTNISQK